MNRTWVFTQLVKNKDDTAGFIAYSLYKSDKCEYAEILRIKGYTERQIEKELDIFHRQTAESLGRIKGYRDKAITIINRFFDEMNEEIRLDYESQLDSINKQANKIDELMSEIQRIKLGHKQELLKAQEDAILSFHKAVNLTKLRKKGWIRRSLIWQWNGFSGVFATLMFAIFVYGFCVLLLPQTSRVEIVNGAFNNFINFLYQPPSHSPNTTLSTKE